MSYVLAVAFVASLTNMGWCWSEDGGGVSPSMAIVNAISAMVFLILLVASLKGL